VVAANDGSTLAGEGVFSWLSPTEISACVSPTGTPTMTLTGALTLETV
jgi:hypothetical protein